MSNTEVSRQANTDIDVVSDSTDLSTALSHGNQSLAVRLANAEIDHQITTARAFPRVISVAMSNFMTLATIDEESAEECFYTLPRGGKSLIGPSIRFAELIASAWGNCRDAARVVHVDKFEMFVEAEAVYHDLQTNRATTARSRRRIFDNRGKLYNDDMIIVTGNAACSIARRNAITSGIPRQVWRPAYEAALKLAKGEIHSLAVRREKALAAFGEMGISPEQIFLALEVKALPDINLDHLVTLTAMRNAVKSGESTVDQMFPKPSPKGGGATGASGSSGSVRGMSDALDKLSNKEPTPPHDPETGEIKQDKKSGGEPESGAKAGDGPSSTRGAETKESAPSTSAPKSDASPVSEGMKRTAETMKESTKGATGTAKADKKAAADDGGGAAAAGATGKADDAEGRNAKIIADLSKTAEARAAEGSVSLSSFLVDLNAEEEALITPKLSRAWREMAVKADKAKG